MKTYAKKFPNVDFAITDDSYKDAGGGKNVEGLTYATQEAGCLVGVLAAKMAQEAGRQHDRCGRRPQDPAGRHLDRRLQVLRQQGRAGHEGASCSTRTTSSRRDKCQAVAQNEIGQGAKVLFQVAGGCGLGALKAADAAKLWGIGVDADQYNDAPRVLTSAHQEDGRRRLRRDHAGGGRQVQGRHRPGVRPEEQRRGRRQDQPGRPEGVDHADEQLPGEDHRRQARRSRRALK